MSTAARTPSVARKGLAALAAVGLALVGVALTAAPAHATVNPYVTVDDDGAGATLRQAIMDANASPGLDVITFDGSLANQTIELDPLKGPLVVTEELTILGLGSGSLSIAKASGAFDLFSIEMASPGQPFELFAVTLIGNGAVNSGRGIVSDFATPPSRVLLYDIAFSGLNTSDGGGGAYFSGTTGNTWISNSRFVSTGAGTAGGGLLVEDTTGYVTLQYSRFENSSAGERGGAFAVENIDGVVNLTELTVASNTTQGNGGGGYIDNVESVYVQGTASNYYGGNTARLDGGALWVGETTGVVDVEDATFQANDAVSDDADVVHDSLGGAIFTSVDTDELRVVRSYFVGNEAESGGAVYVTRANTGITVADSYFASNGADNDSTAGRGGALFVDQLDASSNISQTSFLTNRANQDSDGGVGGAIYVASHSETLEIEASTFNGNVATDGTGVAIAINQLWGGNFFVTNSTFDEAPSVSDLDNIVYLGDVDSDVRFVHDTFVGDLNTVAVGKSDGTVLLSHSIFEGAHSGATGDDIEAEWSIFRQSAASLPDVTSLAGNQFATDPKLGPLQDNGGPTLTRLLLADSPAIDTGNPAVVSAPVYDQRGIDFDRIQHVIIDIGAIEVPYTAPLLPPTGAAPSTALLLGGGVVLLLGLALLVFAGSKRRPQAN